MALLMAGGFPMVFIVVFGVVALVGATRFALAPEPGRVGSVVSYGAAVSFAAIAGSAFDYTFVARAIASNEEWDQATRWLVLVIGVGESLSPLILASAILAVVSLVTAVGLRRMPLDQ